MPAVWDTSYPWLESDIQRYIVAKLRKEPGYNRDWCFAADMNGQVVDPDDSQQEQEADLIEASLLGLEPGEPDLRFYLRGGRILLIELKRKRDGRPSPEQRKRIRLLRRLGHKAGIVHASCPWDGFQQTIRLVNRYSRRCWFW